MNGNTAKGGPGLGMVASASRGKNGNDWQLDETPFERNHSVIDGRVKSSKVGVRQGADISARIPGLSRTEQRLNLR